MLSSSLFLISPFNFRYLIREAEKKNLNGSAIKAMPPPPFELGAVGTILTLKVRGGGHTLDFSYNVVKEAI